MTSPNLLCFIYTEGFSLKITQPLTFSILCFIGSYLSIISVPYIQPSFIILAYRGWIFPWITDWFFLHNYLLIILHFHFLNFMFKKKLKVCQKSLESTHALKKLKHLTSSEILSNLVENPWRKLDARLNQFCFRCIQVS